MAYDGTLKFDTAIDSSGFQAGISKISGIASKGIKATAAVIAGAATAVTGFAASAVKAGGDFEAGMSKVQAISGASGDDMVKLSDKAKEMGAKTKFSASESAEAFQYMAMAGWKTNDMLGSIEGVMNLAAASGEDLGRTSDIVTDAMTAFGLAADGTTTIIKDGFSKEVSNATHFADVLAQSASNSNTNVSMLGESFKYVAPVAGSLGYNIEDTSIALGLMANQGIKASTAGTALRQLLTNMAKPTDKMADAMDYLGISLSNSDGSMKSLKEIMDDLRKSFGQCKMPMEEYQKQLADLQSKYESGQLTEKKYNKYLEDLTEKAYGAEGALKAKYAATLAGQEGMSGLLAIVNTSAEDYDKLTESIYNADGAAEKMADTMNDNLQGAITLIAGAILAVTNFVDMFKNGFNAVKDILMGIGIALAAVGAVILGAPAAVAAVVAGIVYAVANLVIVIKEHWDQILEFIQQIPEKVGEIVDAVVTWFEELPGRISEFLSQIISAIQEWGSKLLEAATQAVSTAIDAVVHFFSELPYKIGYALGFVIGKLVDFGKNAINWVKTNIPIIIENIVNFFSQLPGKVWNWLTETFNKIVTWGSNTLQKAREIASNTVEAIVNFFSQLPGKIWNWLSNALQKVTEWGTELAEKGIQAASSLCNAVLNGIANLPSQMVTVGYNIVTGVWNGICNAAGWFESQVRNFFSGIVDGVKSALGIHSPSRVFADEVGQWIPPGIGEGIEDKMPDLYEQMDTEMSALGKRMQMAVKVETGKIAIDKNANTTYKVVKEKQGVFDSGDTTVEINGETHVHVDLDGKEVGRAQAPIVDRNLARIDSHKKRGG